MRTYRVTGRACADAIFVLAVPVAGILGHDAELKEIVREYLVNEKKETDAFKDCGGGSRCEVFGLGWCGCDSCKGDGGE